jgi:Bacterial Ig-like domain (group 1)
MNLKNNLKISQAMLNISKTALCATLVSATLLIQGCGGNGAGAAGAGSSSTGVAAVTDAISPLAKSVDVLSSQPSLPSDGRTTANITIVVKDAGNRALENAPVSITSTDSQSLLQVFGTKTASDGTLKATLTSSGKSNRTIPITALVGTVSKTLNIQVSGTSVAINGPSAVANGTSGNYTISLRDSGGVAIPNVPVTVASSAGNAFTPSSVTTDSNGQAKFSLAVTKPTGDQVTVSAAGSTSSLSIVVAPSSLSFVNLSVLEEVNVAGSKQVRVKLTDTAGVSGKTLLVSSTRGAVSPASGSVLTDGNGEATFSVSSATAGIATISVTGPSQTSVNSQVEFISTIPANVLLQPSKALIPANPLGSSANSSLLTANARDSAGNPVKGVKINFRADLDPSSGKIEPGFAVTDSAGNASVAFVAGPNSTGSNGVKLSAFVESAPSIISSANMTVTNGEISVRIGTSNFIEGELFIRYRYLWTALVVDSSGNPVKDALVQVQVVPVDYRKGIWTKVAGWVPVYSATCASEDGISPLAPLDGVLQPIEDINLNGRLDPGGVATVSFVIDSKTGADGFSDFYIKWAKEFSGFTKIRIDVKAQVKGSEATVSESFILPLSAEDATSSAAPGINVSGFSQGPFGNANTCSNPN